MTKRVLIIGAGRGVGRAAAIALAEDGHDVVAVSRTAADLDSLTAEASGVSSEVADAAADGAIADLLSKHAPDIVLQVGGTKPAISLIGDYTWDDFCATWQNDTKISFNLAQAALSGALPSGGVVLVFSSGAALNGSPMSGGYAGAKRTQHYVMNYAQMEAEKRELDLTFTTLYPKQLIAGTDIALATATAYGEMRGADAASFMSQWEKQLTPEALANHVRGLVSEPKKGAFIADGAGMAELP